MTQSTAQGLANLAARLTKPEDRETYAGLVSYFHSLPAHDELFHLVELLGLLTLLGQRVPDALADAMAQMRQLTDKAGEYYGEIDERLDCSGCNHCRCGLFEDHEGSGRGLTAAARRYGPGEHGHAASEFIPGDHSVGCPDLHDP